MFASLKSATGHSIRHSRRGEGFCGLAAFPAIVRMRAMPFLLAKEQTGNIVCKSIMTVILSEAKDLARTANSLRAEAKSFASLRMTQEG
jgi:hypothetical protein